MMGMTAKKARIRKARTRDSVVVQRSTTSPIV